MGGLTAFDDSLLSRLLLIDLLAMFNLGVAALSSILGDRVPGRSTDPLFCVGNGSDDFMAVGVAGFMAVLLVGAVLVVTDGCLVSCDDISNMRP